MRCNKAHNAVRHDDGALTHTATAAPTMRSPPPATRSAPAPVAKTKDFRKDFVKPKTSTTREVAGGLDMFSVKEEVQALSQPHHIDTSMDAARKAGAAAKVRREAKKKEEMEASEKKKAAADAAKKREAQAEHTRRAAARDKARHAVLLCSISP